MANPLRRPVRFGTAELVPDPWRPTGRILTVDDVPQSYVDLADPSHLQMPYSIWIAQTINHHWPDDTPIAAVHVGGGACTLPRYLATTRPGSTQTVFELDALLVDLLREPLGLDDLPGVRLEVGDGRSGLVSCPDHSADLVVLDAFRGGDTVTDLATLEFVDEVFRVLRPRGLYTANLWAAGDLTFLLRAFAAVTAVFPYVLAFAEPSVFMKWRPGNVVIVASTVDLVNWTATAPGPVTCLTADELAEVCGTAAPLTEGDPVLEAPARVDPWARLRN